MQIEKILENILKEKDISLNFLKKNFLKNNMKKIKFVSKLE